MGGKRRTRGDGGLYKRASDGMWVGSVEIAPADDGRRRRRVVASKDRATALQKLRELRRLADSGQLLPAGRSSTQAWLTRWVDTIARPQIRPNTYRSYKGSIDTHIAPAIGEVRLTALRPDDVRKVQRVILAKGLSTRTAELAHTVLARALRDAVREGLIPRSPAEHVARPKVHTASRGALTTTQAMLLLAKSAANPHDPMTSRWAAALMLGARQAELLGLRWADVDLDNGLAYLDWQLQRLPLKTGATLDASDRFDVPAGFEHIPLHRRYALTRPKTSRSQRAIPLPDPLLVTLRVHHRDTPPNTFDLVWSTPQGLPIPHERDSRAWHAALDHANIPDVPLHAARHTTASLLLEAGVPEKVIQDILGHSSIVTTRAYQHVDQTLARKALANLDGLMGGPVD